MICDQDPMNTCCRVNDGMENEYDMEAEDIILMLEQGVPFRNAYCSSMGYFFNSGSIFETEHLFAIVQMDYYTYLSKHDPGTATYEANTVIHNRASRTRQSSRNYWFWMNANRLVP